jgi:hypothetical protein
MSIPWLLRTTILAIALLLGRSVLAGEIPRFEVDPFWPRPLPNNWILGQIAGIAVDAQDNGKRVQKFRPINGAPAR